MGSWDSEIATAQMSLTTSPNYRFPSGLRRHAFIVNCFLHRTNTRFATGRDQSARSAVTGSTRAARHAGASAANIATSRRASAMTIAVAGSLGFTP